MVNDPILQFIYRMSFDSIYKFIGKESRPESRGSMCLLCSDVFKDIASADLLRTKLGNPKGSPYNGIEVPIHQEAQTVTSFS